MNSRTRLFDRILVIFFLTNLFLQPLNEWVFENFLPERLTEGLFWFSLGLYGGFFIYKNEVIRMWRIDRESGKIKESNEQ